MAPVKKATKKSTYNSPFKKGEEGARKKEAKDLTADEIKNVQAMVKQIGSGKQNGIIIVLEEFKEGEKRGIQGVSFCHNIGPSERIQAIVPALGMPISLIMVIMAMMQKEGME